ncbi:MAG: hypothetical protein U5K70_05945 [Halodesulfurarchaeum sp.]|nr:hypothetical protein [Halodesulfurarchaeum sp.]
MTEDDDHAESIPLADLRSDIENEEPADGDMTEEVTAADDATHEATDEADSVPLSGLRDEVDRRARDDPEREEAVADEAFMEETVEPVDSEGVWADLLMEDDNPEGHFEAAETEAGAEGPTQVISKRICERCRYLEAPPELKCTHQGTTIHELVDMGHVRVSDCPMVGPDGKKTRPGRSEDQ